MDFKTAGFVATIVTIFIAYIAAVAADLSYNMGYESGLNVSKAIKGDHKMDESKSDSWIFETTQTVTVKISFEEELSYEEAVDALMGGDGDIYDETNHIIENVLYGEPL